MESKQNMPSVIAVLMGFDELSTQQPVQKRQRVLSEKYLQRVASLGARKNFQSNKYLSRKSSESVKERKDVEAARSQTSGLFYDQWDQKQEANSGSKFFKSSSVSYSRSSNVCRNTGKNEKVKMPPFSRYQLYSKERARLSRSRILNGDMKLRNTSHIHDADWKDKYFGSPRLRRFSAYSATPQGHRRGRNMVLNSNIYTQHNDFGRTVPPRSEMQNGSKKKWLSRSRDKESQSAHFDTKSYLSSLANYLIVDEQSKLNQQEGICEKRLVTSASLKKSSYFMKDDDSSSQSADDSFLQDTSNVCSEDGFGPSDYSGTDHDSLTSLEGYQPSPDSVLEIYFKDEQVARAECIWGVGADPQGLKMHLGFLKSNPSATYSEGSEVNVSSDEGNGQESMCCSQENMGMKRLFRAEESMDFSYLVDVLSEASFLERELDQAYKEWHMPDCPIGLHVFELLEKKYCEQTCWKRSDRRLLFDRINLGLVEIFMPCMGVHTWTKPVSKRLPGWYKEAVEDELWMLLIKQEREFRDALSNDVVPEFERLLNLGDYVEMIVLELETLLVEELAAEVVSLGRL